MVVLHSTWLYITLPWLYFTLLDSTLLYNGSTSLYFTLYYSIPFSGGFRNSGRGVQSLAREARPQILGLPRPLPVTLEVRTEYLEATLGLVKWLEISKELVRECVTIPGCCYCMLLLHNHLMDSCSYNYVRQNTLLAAKGGCICTPLTPPKSATAITLLPSTLLYIGSTALYVTLQDFIMALLHSAWLYITLPQLYFTILDSTLLYHGSTSLYLTLHYSIMAVLHSTCLYITVLWLHFILLDSTLLYHHSTSLYLTPH